MPVGADVPLKNHNWFWSGINEKKLRNPERLLHITGRWGGRDAALEAAPSTTGLIPTRDMALSKGLDDEICIRFGKSLAETSRHDLLLEVKLPAPATHGKFRSKESLWGRIGSKISIRLQRRRCACG